MRKVLIDLNKNLVTLNDKLSEMILKFYDKQMRKLMEKLISRSSSLFFDVVHAIEQLKWDKVTDLLLGFLDEADAFIDDIAWRLPAKSVDKISHTIRELLQVIRAQVIFLDQFRQANFVYSF
jgi:methionyl-tRNA synthetase